MSCCKEFRRTGIVTGAKLLSWIVPYSILSVPVRSGIVKVAFGMVTYCAVLGLFESGTVPYGNGLGRTGTVTTNSEIVFNRLMIDYSVFFFCTHFSIEKAMRANVRQFEDPYQ